MFPLSTVLIGVAVAVDSFAGGVWLGHRWGTSSNANSVAAAVKEAVARATTLPAGGIPAMAQEVAQGAQAVAAGVAQTAQAVTDTAQQVTAVAQTGAKTVTDVRSALNAAMIAATHANAPK